MWSDRFAKVSEPKPKQTVVRVNAWEDDYCGDPLVSIVSALIDALENEKKPTENIVNAIKDVGNLSLAVLGQVSAKLSGVDLVKAGKTVKDKKAIREDDVSRNFFELYRLRKDALIALKAAIREFVNGDEPEIIILIDELDRCRPDYAISCLETIKHVFDIKGLVFILAIDRGQLECSAKAAFGGDLVFSGSSAESVGKIWRGGSRDLVCSRSLWRYFTVVRIRNIS